MNFKALALTALITATSFAAAPNANANGIIQREQTQTSGRVGLAREFMNAPLSAKFNQPKRGGTTTLVEKCEARRHFQGKGYFFKTKKMSAQILAQHTTPKGFNRNELCEIVLDAAGK